MLDVTVEVFDDQGTVQAGAQVVVRPGETVAVTLVVAELDRDRFRHESPVVPPFLAGEAATVLRARVRQRVDRGDLPEGAMAEVDEALRPLEWLSSLQADAHAALRGEPDAADRLRLALLGYVAPVPDDEPVDDLGDVLEHATEPATGPAEGIVDDSGLLAVVAAAVHVAATDAEANLLVGGLSRAAWSGPFVEALVGASRTDDPQPMRTLMGLPPGDLPMPPGGLPGGGKPGGGLPGEFWPGGKPGWPQVPGKRKGIPGIRVGPVVADLVAHFRTPVNKTPTEHERCLVGAMVQVARIKQALPRYAIRSFDNPNACPGELLTIRGERFGAAGRVVFQGSSPAGVMPLAWTDDVIHVVVPADATPGPIRLSILDQVLRLCGQTFPIYRLGDTLAAFNGGLPRVTSFFLNGVDGDTSAAPGSKVDLQFTTSTGELTSVDVRVVDPAGAVVFQTVVPGGFHAFSFTAPPVSTGPVDLAVSVAVHGVCGISTRSATLVVTHQPDLRILDVEVTQAIQRLDNTVRLAARRRTMVRLYLGNGLGNHRPFSYTATPSELPGVTGSVTLWRGTTRLAVISPTPAVITSRFFFQPSGREGLSLSLNFDLPVGVLDGPLRIEARVWLATRPHGVLDGPHTNDVRSVTVTFEPTNHVRIVRVLLQDDSRPMVTTPTAADFGVMLQGARARMPLPDDGWEIYLPPGSPVVATNHDLTTEDGWSFVLEDIDDIAEDTTNAWSYAWTGVIAAELPGAPLELNGMGRKGDGEHDYPAMVAQAGLAATFAHELAHVFGFGHAPCGSTKDIDPDLPGYIEETGVDVHSGTTFPAGMGSTGELMSYCSGQSRWVSIALWTKMMNLLKV